MAAPLFSTYPNYESLANTFYNPNSTIARMSNSGRPQSDFLYANIKEFEDSPERAVMLAAQEYYKNKNDIKNRKKWFFGRKGEKFEMSSMSNTKLSHPYLFKLINQKINYLLTNDFDVKVTDNENYQTLLKTDYFNKGFLQTLRRVVTHSIINGLSWIQVYYNQLGELKFKRIPSEEVIPFWADEDHTILDAVIRYYTLTEYLPGGGKKRTLKVEFYDNSGVWYYTQTNNGLQPDPEKAQMDPTGEVQVPQSNFNLTSTDDNGEAINYGARWDRIPFIPFKYNPDEMSLLQLIKSLIDDYDDITSDASNSIKDEPNKIKVIKGYKGTDKEQFSHNLSLFRTIFVSEDGGVDTVDGSLDFTSLDAHIERLRKDIHSFAAAVDTQETDLGNASGTALKFRYADLDNDMSTLEGQLQQSFEQLAWFIDIDAQIKGKGDFTNIEFLVEFNKAGIINDSELIADCKASVGIISDETILSHHPWVEDPVKEKAALDTQRQEELTQMEDELTVQNKFSNNNSGSNNSGYGGKSNSKG